MAGHIDRSAVETKGHRSAKGQNCRENQRWELIALLHVNCLSSGAATGWAEAGSPSSQQRCPILPIIQA